jgi:hypothetical protein
MHRDGANWICYIVVFSRSFIILSGFSLKGGCFSWQSTFCHDGILTLASFNCYRDDRDADQEGQGNLIFDLQCGSRLY